MKHLPTLLHHTGHAVVTGARMLLAFVCRGGPRAVAFALVTLFALTAPAWAAYDIVSTDGSGNVTFTPGSLVTPILTGVVAAVGSAAALVVLAVGVRWIYRMVKSR